MKAEVCLVGEAAVGKTSLIRRFTVNEYDDRYVMTVGAKVSRKDLRARIATGEVDVTLSIWDIMGVRGFRQLLQEAYFTGAQGLLAVADVTRASTLEDLGMWIEAARAARARLPSSLRGTRTTSARPRS